MNFYFIGIAILILGAIFSLAVKNPNNKLKTISVFSVIGALNILVASIKTFISGANDFVFNLGSVFQNVRFSLDNISAFFAIIIAVMSTLAIIYSNGYLKPYIEKGKNITAHCLFLIMLMASMLGVVVCQNALMFLIIWELMSLSSFFLCLFEYEQKEVISSGIKYLVYMHLSVIFIIIFFALLSIQAHSLDFNYFYGVAKENIQLANLIFIFGFIGFGIKAGFVPFHNWLPDAHPKAPSHVSAMMSGVMIKTGVYGIIRALEICSIPTLSTIYLVLILSIITALYGISYASVQKDIKKMLAYSSIENMGIIGIGIGVYLLATHYEYPTVALIALCGSFAHILNHSIFKELLFLSAGSVYIKTHTKNMELLGGLIKKMPITAICFILGGISICALPPFNGFVSEFLIYMSFIKALDISNFGVFIVILFALASLALVGTIAILCFTKTISIAFLGESRSEHCANEDNPKSMLVSMSILACACLVLGLFPQYVFKYTLLPARVFIDYGCACKQIEFLSTISKCLWAFVGLIILFLLIKKAISNKTSIYSTWGCGYNKLTSKMQYSGASYTSPFLNIVKPLFKRTRDVKKAKGLFPTDAHYETRVDDIEETYIINPILKWDEKFLSKFEIIQNGDIQQYIRFGLAFLALALIVAILII
ncbi:MAG: hypothetical protein IJB79_07095 [Candidatus Gastranaerophilales bacterium]|nr:hypothetical protein [Candidatus Gastranaerophilales bacterium]